ncbi:permease family protein [Pseudomonas chlororaphis subsp. aureofaciens 30-84]|nr:permease family protein [Pseudomonas chlororaphis subsp. aureofaciens 30-84]
MSSLAPASPVRGWSFWWKPALFVLVACVGLYFVKWSPYYAKAFIAADSHSIGASIINDQPSSPLNAALAYAQVYFLAIWKAAVLAVILGSLLQVLIPRDWLLRLFGRAGFGSTLRGGLFALPGMMCSCCAAPVAASMRRQNVSVGAALAFWIANPVLNPATLVFMGFVLGWGFTALRLVAGIVLVLGVSLVAQRIARPEQLPEAAVEAVVEASTGNEGAFFSRWARSLWQLFWSTIPIYPAGGAGAGRGAGLAVPPCRGRDWRQPAVAGAAGDCRHAVRDSHRRGNPHRADHDDPGHGHRPGGGLADDPAEHQPAVAFDAAQGFRRAGAGDRGRPDHADWRGVRVDWRGVVVTQGSMASARTSSRASSLLHG